MPRLNRTCFEIYQPHARQDDSKSLKIKSVQNKKLLENFLTQVTDLSDTGTYEIVISEGQTPEHGSLTTAAISADSFVKSARTLSKCESSSLRKGFSYSQQIIVQSDVDSEKTNNKIIQSYYPCFCIAEFHNNDESNSSTVLISKATSTCDSEYEIPTENSTTRQSVKCDSAITPTDSEPKEETNNRSESSCSSNKEILYENSSQKPSYSSGELTKLFNCDGSNSSCNSVEFNSSARINYIRCPISSKKLTEKKSELLAQRTKNISVVNMITEQREELRTEEENPSESCKCYANKYKEKLSNLKDLHCFTKLPVGQDELSAYSQIASSDRSCECKLTPDQYDEIKQRIEALENVFFCSLGDERSSTSTKGSSHPVKTGFELSKIKHRLKNLERKIMTQKLRVIKSAESFKKQCTPQNDEKNGDISKINVLDKDVQEINLDEGHRLRFDEEPSADSNKLPAYWVTKILDIECKIKLKDESIQTQSQNLADYRGGDVLLPVSGSEHRRRFKPCDEVHLCKECDYYISQARTLISHVTCGGEIYIK